MAKIIEIAGPAGVGKTTILNGLIKSWNKDFPWILNHKLYPQQKINPASISSIAQNLPNLVLKRKTNLDNRVLYDVGRRFITENSAYIDAYWNSLNSNYTRDLNGFDGRFDSAAKFYSKIQKYQYVKEHSTHKYVLFDEGLIHDLGGRVPIKNNALEKELQDIDRIVPFMPVPAMWILIDTDIETILSRLASRNKILQMHKEKSGQELRDLTETVKRRFEYLKQLMIQKGVTVLSIDSGENVQLNTNKINQSISQLNLAINP